MIERVQEEMPEIVQSSRLSPKFSLKVKRQSAKAALVAEGIKKAYLDREVLAGISFSVLRGQKISVIGPNGIGKSTLLKILVNEVKADSGVVTWSDNADVAYYSQSFQMQSFQHNTLLEWLSDSVEVKADDAQVRQALAKMLFTKDDVLKKIKFLSGGELTRLVFAKIILEQPNMLVLDEPTNHLDLEAIESLAQGLTAFDGTILLVSHNRYLINSVANRILAIGYNDVHYHEGNFNDFLSQAGSTWFKQNTELALH